MKISLSKNYSFILAGVLLTSICFAKSAESLDSICKQIAAGGLAQAWKSSGGQMGPSYRSRIQSFVSSNLSESKSAKNVFYPFSGPDVFYPNVIFANLRNLTLVGLEPVGGYPQASHGGAVMAAYHSLFSSSFLVTKDMASQLSNLGTAPMICGALSAMGYEVKAIQLRAESVTFSYKAGRQSRTLTYLRHNLANGGISADFQRTVIGPGLDATLLKATQYCPQQGGFESINNLILNSRMIIQSATGIAYRRLVKENWKVRLYGQYFGPYGESFASYPQTELKDAYAQGKAGKLGFIYDYGINSNLMIALRPR